MPADDEALSDAFQQVYDRAAPGGRTRRSRAEQLAEEDERAREAMGDNPLPAGDYDEV